LKLDPLRGGRAAEEERDGYCRILAEGIQGNWGRSRAPVQPCRPQVRASGRQPTGGTSWRRRGTPRRRSPLHAYGLHRLLGILKICATPPGQLLAVAPTLRVRRMRASMRRRLLER